MTLSFADGPADARVGDPPVAKTDASGYFRLPSREHWTRARQQHYQRAPGPIQLGEAPSQDITVEVVRAELLCVELRPHSLTTTRPVYGNRWTRSKDFVREPRVSIKDPAGRTRFEPPNGFATAGVAAKAYVPARHRYDVQVFDQGRLITNMTDVETSRDPRSTIRSPVPVDSVDDAALRLP